MPPETKLDFEKADFGAPAAGVQCASCPSAIRDTYFEINGATVCTRCRALIAELERAEGGMKRFALATLFGIAGGAAGAAIWYAVARLFNLEIGLIAILVGWLVGTGVHKGAQGRGGWRYQLLAAFVTYASIVTTYIPPIYAELSKNSADPAAPSNGKDAAAKPTTPETPSTVPAPASSSAASPEPPSLLRALLALVFAGAILYAVAFAAPFLMGFENLIGILIIGFAVRQAWKMNARRVLDIKGPFRVAARASAVSAAPTPTPTPTDAASS